MIKKNETSANVAATFSQQRLFPARNLFTACVTLFVAAVVIAVIQPRLGHPGSRLVLSVLFQCGVLGIFVLLGVKMVLSYLSELGYKIRGVIFLAAAYLFFCIAGLLFLHYYFLAEQDIKIYDSTVYWLASLDSQEMLANSIPEYLLLFRNTLANEYGFLLAFPLSLAFHVFGDTFTAYCQSVFFVYYLPSCLFLSILAVRLVAKAQKRAPGIPAFLAAFSLVALFPLLMWPVVLGYTDIGGVLFIAIILNYTLEWDGVEFSWRRNCVLVGLSVLLLLSRRWYAFYIVGFYTALFVFSFVRMLVERTFTARRFASLVASLAVIAGISTVVILLLNPNILTAFLGRDYAEAYSAFKVNGALASAWYYLRHAGIAFIIAFLFGVAWFLRKTETVFVSLRMLGAGVIAMLLFLRVQDPGAHHEYLMTPTLLVFLAAFVAYWTGEAPRKARPFIVIGLLPILAANFAFAFVPAFQGAAEAISPLPTSIRSYPKHLENYDAYYRIHADLLEKTQGRADSVYIVGEGEVFNPEYFRRLDLPRQRNAAGYAMSNSTVDLRDGFPSQLFAAEYVMFADPFSTMFSSVQQIGYQVYDMFLHDPVVANYYALDTTYPLANHEARLYRKIRPIDRACVDVLKERLRKLYPDAPFVYEPEYLLALMDYDRHMIQYNFWDNFLLFRMENGEPVHFRLNDVETFSTLSFEVESQIQGVELVLSNQDGEIFRTPVQENARAAVTREISGNDSLVVTFEDPNAEPATTGLILLHFDANSLR